MAAQALEAILVGADDVIWTVRRRMAAPGSGPGEHGSGTHSDDDYPRQAAPAASVTISWSPARHPIRHGARRVRARGVASLRERRPARYPPAPQWPRLRLHRSRRPRDPRSRHPGPDPDARGAPSVARGLDLLSRRRTCASDGSRRAWPEAVSVPHALARGARRDQARPHGALRARATHASARE
jgi:hypothetical protein